jgi:hypothetical protein
MGAGGRSVGTCDIPIQDAVSAAIEEANFMDATAKEKRLTFLRRMIWWMPVLVFAILAAWYTGFNKLTGQDLPSIIIQSLIPAIIVGILVLAIYFGYKYMLDRNSSV